MSRRRLPAAGGLRLSPTANAPRWAQGLRRNSARRGAAWLAPATGASLRTRAPTSAARLSRTYPARGGRSADAPS